MPAIKKFSGYSAIALIIIFLVSSPVFSALTRPARIAIEFQYDDARDFHEGLAAVKKKGNWGYIDIHGQEAIQIAHKVLEPGNFSEGVAFLGDHYIDLDGNPAFITEDEPGIKFFDRGREFSSGLAAVKIGGLWGFIDMFGHLIIPYEFVNIGSFHDGLAKFYSRGRWGYIDRNGKIRIKAAFYEAGDFNNGLAPVRMRTNYRGWGFINKAGRFAIKRRYNFAEEFSDGLAGVAGDARYGFINARAEWEYSPFYDGVRKFSEGFAAVRQGSKWGYIVR